MKTCVDCKYLQRDTPAKHWHQCGYPEPARVPKALALVHCGINLEYPFRNCAAWEAAATPG